MKKRSLVPKKIQDFYNDVSKKRTGQMRLQTNH